MDFKYYNVHFIGGHSLKCKITITALSKEDAKNTFENYAKVEGNGYGVPFEAKPTKVIGPLGMHPSTPKQQLAHQYRSCIGAACMLEKNIQSILINSLAIQIKAGQARILALKQVAKCKRDIADMFKLMGLKIKHG